MHTTSKRGASHGGVGRQATGEPVGRPGRSSRGVRKQAPILMYHAIRRTPPGADPHGVCVSPDKFEEQMAFLARRGLRGVSMRELLAPGSRRRLVGLTFDDGYEDFLSEAVPILKSHGFSATVFALAGMLGGENLWDTRSETWDGDRRGRETPARLSLMDAKALLECESRGMEVGSHGLYHGRLPELTEDRLFDEVSRSRRVLGRILGRSIEGFCYPYGAVDERVALAARSAGYRYAVSHKARPEGTRMDLSRVYAGEEDGTLKLGAKLALARLPGVLGAARGLSRFAARRRARPRGWHRLEGGGR